MPNGATITIIGAEEEKSSSTRSTADQVKRVTKAVSYTHLTLPTNREV